MAQAVTVVFLAGLILVGLALHITESVNLDDDSFSTFLLTAGCALVIGDVLFVMGYAVYGL
jgi:hypothetical protein